MTDAAEGGKGDYLGLINEIIRQNDHFVREHATEAYNEVVELMNDAIDHLPRGTDIREASKDAGFYFAVHVLMPVSHAVYMDMLVGNLPACFMQLRLALESLAKCHVADARYPHRAFFQERVQLLEKDNLRIYEVLEEAGAGLGLTKDFVALWGKLSQQWAHGAGSLDRMVMQVVEHGMPPPWAMVIPGAYGKEDIESLEELRKRVAQFRRILTAAMSNEAER